MASFSLHPLDIAIIALYFLMILGLGLYFAVKAKRQTAGGSLKTEDFFLAGKSLAWGSIGFSLFASNISSTTLIGLSGAAYATGISISNYEWMATVILIFFAVFFIPHYVGKNIFTMPEFLGNRFDGTVRYYFSVLTIVGNIFIDTAGTLFAGALVVKFFFPAIELWQSAAILALVAGFYTAAGGLLAVVYTDVIQAIILLIGSTVITLIAYAQVGPWSDIVAMTPPDMLSVVRPRSDPTMPWTGLVVGVPILGFYFWCTNQFIVQRVLGAKNIEHARWGALFGGFLKLSVLFIMVYPGIMARLLFPSLETPDLVFPTMVTQLLPIGLKGLVLAGLIAAIMSSIDSTLHSASTLITIDFVKKLRPETSPAGLTAIGRAVTIAVMVISILWLPVVARFDTLFEYLQSALAYLVPPVVAVFLLGLFWQRASSRGALAGLLVGHATSLSVLVAKNLGYFPSIHFLELAGVFAALSAAVIVLVSVLDPAPDYRDKLEWTWSRKNSSELTADLPQRVWWQDYRVHSAILMLLTAWVVVANW